MMARYTKSFFLTLTIYTIIITVLLYLTSSSLHAIKAHKNDNTPLKVSLIEFQNPQKPSVIQPKNELKEKPKEKPKKKKIQKAKKIVKVKKIKKPIKKIIKKEPIKPVKKVVAKKIEEPKPQQIAEEKIVKVEEKKEEMEQPPATTQKSTIAKQMVKPSLSDKQLDQVKKQYFSQIKQTIDKNKTYPKIAVRRGIEGLIKIKFTLSKEGELLSYNILKGQRIFKKSVIEAIEKSFPLIPPPNIFTSNIDLFLTLNYKLY